MVREAERRLGKFDHKVDAEVLSLQTKALKPLMVRGEAKYFPEIVTVEQKVKSLVEAEGVSTLKVRDYLNFGREMYILTKKFSKVTLSAEAQLKVNKWSDRGLDGSLLVGIAKLFGVTPSAPPAPPIVGYLDDLLDVEIVTPLDKEVLTYDQPTDLWKNKPPIGGICQQLFLMASLQSFSYIQITTFQPLAGSTSYAGAFEVSAQHKVVAGKFTKLRVQVTSNTLNQAVTIGLRVNGATSALQISIPTGATGWFELDKDVSVADGDLCNYITTSTATSGTVNFKISSRFVFA